MVRKLFLLGAALFLLAGCQPNVSVNYGNSNSNANVNANANANNNVNAVNNANVNAAANTNTAPTLVGTIFEVKISENTNAKGIVENNKTSFSKDAAEIFVSASISGAAAGLVATAELVYLPTGDKVGPVSNPPADGGDVISNFSFTKPTNGWPAGNYNVNVTLSNGQAKTAPFIVQ